MHFNYKLLLLFSIPPHVHAFYECVIAYLHAIILVCYN